MAMSRCALLLLLLLCSLGRPGVAAAERPGPGCNVHGCFPAGGGCNVHGCFRNGGGCNVHGCWNSPAGSCNVHGCSDAGACNVHGCPPPRRGPRHLTPGGAGAPGWAGGPTVAPASPPDYAQDLGEVRSFSQAGLRFDYPAGFTATVDRAARGAYVTLNGPRSLSAFVARIETERAPEVVRGELAQGLGGELVQRGLRSLGTSAIAAEFRDGSRRGVRDRFDNRDDVYIQDCFAWRRGDGAVVVVMFTYKSRDAALAASLLPVIARSVQ